MGPFELFVEEEGGRSAARRWPIARGCTVGQERTCDVALADEAVAGTHLRLSVTAEGALHLVAFEAVRVDGVEVVEGIVPPYAAVRLGRSRVTVVPSAAFGLLPATARSGVRAVERFVVVVGRVARAGAPTVVEGPPERRAAVVEALLAGHPDVVRLPAEEEGASRLSDVASRGGAVVFEDVDRLTVPAQAALARALRRAPTLRRVATTTTPWTVLRDSGFRNDLAEFLGVVPLVVPPPRAEPPRPFGASKAAVIEAFERRYAQAALAWSGGHVARAAERAGINRASLYRLLDRLDRTPAGA